MHYNTSYYIILATGASTRARAQGWLDAYRELLDRWRLWHERARLDCELRQLGAGVLTVKPDILLQLLQCGHRCSFCSAAIGGAFLSGGSSALQQQMARPQRQGGFPQGRAGRQGTSRALACPHCNKALPRCAICLLHLGEGLGRQPGTEGGAFDEWFSWCLACRHGGHARHLSEWFAEHVECPVSNCKCRCAHLDPAFSTVEPLRAARRST
ncbi:hypothetical protein T492DRAFT_842260 [Pavlovales sp. CCMP2436]|nr:hypothetical protein T492DRAFT_842260 [Pavlovales sp. CCMP2436]